ncbi:MAG: MBL fold metallo-hydrolase [Bacteroidetes bacterium]|nr:MBL fold metallo-hydrolase [Bacteroidota bacterium]
MKITFLGTGTSQGVPVIACDCKVCKSNDLRDKRLRSSITIEKDGWRFVVDCGPDFRQQMLREDIRSIDAILVTHGHKDHLGGLDDVRAFNYINHRPAQVYASGKVQRIIKLEFAYAFEKNPYPGVPEIVLHRLVNKPFDVNGQKIIPIRALHYKNDQYVFGFRIDDFTYITDAVNISEKEKKKIKGSKIIVLNALRKQKHYSHFNLEEALALMDELKPEQGYLTHISHQMGTYASVNPELPGNVKLAYDGLTLTF